MAGDIVAYTESTIARTENIRWCKRPTGQEIDGEAIYETVLQQMYKNLTTGEVEWEDVPEVTIDY